MATVVSVAVAAALLIALGVKEGDVVLEFSGGLLAFVDLIILVAKGLENITPKTLSPREINDALKAWRGQGGGRAVVSNL